MKTSLVFAAVLFTSLTALAQIAPESVPKLGGGEPIILCQESESSFFNQRYQLGDEWGKIEVTNEVLKKSAVIRRAAMATARVGGATGFYLGEFNGAHIVATNKHVCPSPWSCRGSVRFPLLNNSRHQINSVLGRFPEIDLALLEISVDSRSADGLKKVAGNFAFTQSLFAGQKLVTIGFGTANNPRRRMVANFDSDCVVFSGGNEYRKMRDPDQINTGSDLVWSFANGCDVSHGDSGSAMVDRETGDVLGLIWTGRIPKSTRVQNSRYLENLLKQPTEEIWQELSYAVPAAKIKEVLNQRIQSGRDSDRVKSIFRAILAD